MKWRRTPAKIKLIERKNRCIQFKVELEKKIQRKISFCSNTLKSKKEDVEEPSDFNIIETFTDVD